VRGLHQPRLLLLHLLLLFCGMGGGVGGGVGTWNVHCKNPNHSKHTQPHNPTHTPHTHPPPGDFSDLSLTFTITEERLGAAREVELKPGGAAIPVTAANVTEYVHRVADHRLNKQMAGPVNAFLRGFFDLVRPGWVACFNEWELQSLISGSDLGEGGLDLSDMRRHTGYAGGYHDEGHPVIELFWRVLASFTPPQQRAFLRFTTGCSRPPLLGFAHLEPRLCIAMAGGVLEDAGTERLPTSSACINTLKLPPYGDERRMRDKLLYSITSKAGFDLS